MMLPWLLHFHAAVFVAERRTRYAGTHSADGLKSSSSNVTQCLLALPCTAGSADIPHFAAGTYACLVSGIQEASKGRDGPERSNKVYMLLCVVRLPQHGSDLLVTVNAPAYISPSSSAAQYTEQQGIQPQAEAQAAAVIRGVLSSLQVVDVGLFS
eukprot:GHUV01046167.1.p1 GENE.GHUV01046167.1~~GHUV01046167.1.p1  ORF type:complete len:155 (-),score=36.87 GHUV01046167.1:232-696(-)